jgi:hypothetical protein
VVEHQWVHVGLDRALYGQADTAVINAITPVTGGNRVPSSSSNVSDTKPSAWRWL